VDTGKSTRSKAARMSKGQMRRRLIVRALHDLTLAKGYAEITLSDLAEEVGMSVSHLLYYFDSKESVLEELCRKLNAKFLGGIAPLNDDPPKRRFEALVDYIFTGSSRSRQEYRLTAEMVALSVNRPKIRKIIAEFNREWMDILTAWFQEIPRKSGISAEDAAERTRALLSGLTNNALFDSRLGVRRVSRLCRVAFADILDVDIWHEGRGNERSAQLRDVKSDGHAIVPTSK